MENLECNLVIVAGRAALRDSLHALMTALPQVKVICETDDIAEALHVISRSSTDLALVGDDIPDDELWVFLRLMKKKSPRTLRLIFADTVGRKMEMEAPGADEVFLTGTTPVELVAEIERMLADRAAPSRRHKSLGEGGGRTGDEDDSAFQAIHG